MLHPRTRLVAFTLGAPVMPAFDASAATALELNAKRTDTDLYATEQARAELLYTLSTSAMKDREPYVAQAQNWAGQIWARINSYNPDHPGFASYGPAQVDQQLVTDTPYGPLQTTVAGAFDSAVISELAALRAITQTGSDPQPQLPDYQGNFLPLLTQVIASLDYDIAAYKAWLGPYNAAKSAALAEAAVDQTKADTAAKAKALLLHHYTDLALAGVIDAQGNLVPQEAVSADPPQFDAQGNLIVTTGSSSRDHGGVKVSNDGDAPPPSSAGEGAARGGVAVVTMIGVALLALWGVSKIPSGDSRSSARA